MVRRHHLMLLPTAAVLLLIASTAIAPYNSYTQHPSMDEDLTLIANIEAIRGHLMQALNNKSIGDDDMAVTHAGHPVAEHLGEIAPILEKSSPKLIDELGINL